MPGRHRVGDDRHLGLEVDAPRLVGGEDAVARPEKSVRAALVHQRVGPERVGQHGAARLVHQLDMIDVGTAIAPLEGTRQGRAEIPGIERKDAASARQSR